MPSWRPSLELSRVDDQVDQSLRHTLVSRELRRQVGERAELVMVCGVKPALKGWRRGAAFPLGETLRG